MFGVFPSGGSCFVALLWLRQLMWRLRCLFGFVDFWASGPCGIYCRFYLGYADIENISCCLFWRVVYLLFAFENDIVDEIIRMKRKDINHRQAPTRSRARGTKAGTRAAITRATRLTRKIRTTRTTITKQEVRRTTTIWRTKIQIVIIVIKKQKQKELKNKNTTKRWWLLRLGRRCANSTAIESCLLGDFPSGKWRFSSGFATKNGALVFFLP